MLSDRLLSSFRIALALCLGLVTIPTYAQATHQHDTIWLQPTSKPTAWQPLALERFDGHVRGFNTLSLTWETLENNPDDAASPQEFNLDRLVRWQLAPDSAAESQAMEHARRGEHREAARQWIIAATQYKTQDKFWRRNYLIAQSYQSLYACQEYQSLFEVLKQSPLTERVPTLCALLPLSWDQEPLPQAALDRAKEELQSPSATNRLVAASWLLLTPEKDRAKAVLEKLKEGKSSPFMVRLATAQLWRELSQDQYIQQAGELKSRVAGFPIAVQAGPLIVLARHSQVSEQLAEARDLYLSVTHLYEQPACAIQAAKTALGSLESISPK